MALTPQNSDAFLREVDENLRRDQMIGAARRWGALAIGVIVVFLIGLAAFLWWRSHQAAQAARQGETLNAALGPIENGQPVPDRNALSKLAEDGGAGYRAAARFALAASTLQKGDAIAAATTYTAIANDAGVPQVQRDFALLRAVAIQFDTLPPAQVIDRLKGLAIKGNAFFPSAGELTALAWVKLKRKDKAGPLFAAIAAEPGAPDSIRARAAGMATTLGHPAPITAPLAS